MFKPLSALAALMLLLQAAAADAQAQALTFGDEQEEDEEEDELIELDEFMGGFHDLQGLRGFQRDAPPVANVGTVESPSMAPANDSAGVPATATVTTSSADLAMAPAAGPPTLEGEASRIFAGPGQYPPTNFGAYAIVAFKGRPRPGANDERARYVAICEAYRLSIPDASEAFLPPEQQLVTVWPVRSTDWADEIYRRPESDHCDIAVEHYGLATSLQALRDVRLLSDELRRDLAQRRGPFLFAWNPSSSKGEPDALVLRMDFSSVENYSQAKRRFGIWVQEIESNPDLWLDGWREPGLLRLIGETADIYGEEILSFLSGG